ncbi:MAG: Hpt domain-containing protein, partial [Pseudomonadales bacterium]
MQPGPAAEPSAEPSASKEQEPSAEKEQEPSAEPSASKEQEPSADREQEPSASREPSALETPASVTVELPADEIDEDVLPIFLEEAEELVESIDAGITDWSNDPDSTEHLDLLLRHLHTLKGGSRLAGLASLGEYTHNFETFLIGIQQNPVGLDDAFFALVNQRSDEINRRVGIYNKLAVGEATDEELASMRTAPDAAPTSATAEPSAHEEPSADKEQEPSADKEQEPSADKEQEPAPATDKKPAAQQSQAEMVRVSSDLLEGLIGLAGESSITRGRVEQQIADFGEALEEMEETINRVRDHARRLEIEAESRETVFRSQQAESEQNSP